MAELLGAVSLSNRPKTHSLRVEATFGDRVKALVGLGSRFPLWQPKSMAILMDVKAARLTISPPQWSSFVG